MAYSTLIFDLDGTLIDSVPDLCRLVNRQLRKIGAARVAEEDVIRMVGEGAEMLLKRAFEKVGKHFPEREMTPFYEEFLAEYAVMDPVYTRLYPGVTETLSALKEEGYKIGLCTNKPVAPTHIVLDKLGIEDFFEIIIGFDSTGKRKPDPTPLLEAITRLGSTPEESLMIGDSPADAKTAENAQVDMLIVTYGYSRVPPRDLPGKAYCENFDAVPEAIKSIV